MPNIKWIPLKMKELQSWCHHFQLMTEPRVEPEPGKCHLQFKYTMFPWSVHILAYFQRPGLFIRFIRESEWAFLCFDFKWRQVTYRLVIPHLSRWNTHWHKVRCSDWQGACCIGTRPRWMWTLLLNDEAKTLPIQSRCESIQFNAKTDRAHVLSPDKCRPNFYWLWKGRNNIVFWFWIWMINKWLIKLRVVIIYYCIST